MTRLNGKKGDNLYFSFRLDSTIWSLHEYDAAGTIREVIGARGITDIQAPVVQGNVIYFAGRTPAYGLELYSFERETARRMTDLAPGPKDGLNGIHDAFFDPCFFRDELYFAASTDSVNYQLYAMNMQSATVRRAATINPGGKAMVNNLTVYSGALYYSVYTPATGYELHRYDGTSDQLVPDIWPGGKSALGTQGALSYTRPGFTEFKGQLYFAANDSVHRSELWRLNVPTGVMNATWLGSAMVVPHPATADATLELSLTRADSLAVQVTDIKGRLVFDVPFTPYHAGKTGVGLPLQSRAPGTYLYRVTGSGGQLVASGTISH